MLAYLTSEGDQVKVMQWIELSNLARFRSSIIELLFN